MQRLWRSIKLVSVVVGVGEIESQLRVGARPHALGCLIVVIRIQGEYPREVSLKRPCVEQHIVGSGAVAVEWHLPSVGSERCDVPPSEKMAYVTVHTRTPGDCRQCHGNQ